MWIERIHIQAQVNGIVILSRDGDSLFHDIGHAVLVDIGHGEDVDVVCTQQCLLVRVEIACANNGNRVFIYLWRPTVCMSKVFITDTCKSRENHAMNIAGRRGVARVEVGVGVDPDNANVLINFRNTGNRTERDTMIATK